MFRFAVKAGLATGAVYYVSEQGVWGDSEKTSKIYDTVKKETCPYVKQAIAQLPFELPTLPQTENVMQTCVYYWNCGVKSTFKFLLNSPSCAKNWSKSAYKNIESMLNPPDAPKD